MDLGHTLPQWNVRTDPDIPAEFKRKYAAWLTDPNSWPKPHTIAATAISEYLALAREHFDNDLGPVTKKKLWDRVCRTRRRDYESTPTHPSKILRQIGLWDLPGELRGRPPTKH